MKIEDKNKIKQMILGVIQRHDDGLYMPQLIVEMQICGVTESDTRVVFNDMIKDKLLKVDYENEVIIAGGDNE